MSAQALFETGTICATPGALDALREHGHAALTFFERHIRGDWSEMCAEDQATNADAVTSGLRVFSSYSLGQDASIWVITEADRSVTTCLLPSEY